MENNIKKTYVKIIAPNFDLKYDLDLKEIEERFKKLIRYSNPDKEKKHYLFGGGRFYGYSYGKLLF